MIICGIDPGLNGAVAFIFPDMSVEIIDTPTMIVQKKRSGKAIKEQAELGKTVKKTSNKTEYLPVEMADIFRFPDKVTVFIEKVSARPGQGVSSMFRLGEGYGLWIGIISALKLPLTKVHPATWKKVMMQGISDKDAARGRAQELFPDAAGYFKRKMDCDRADAVLIAEYGRRQLI